MPHTDPDVACEEILRFLPQIPVWPQLPARSFLEGLYPQFSEGFPGIRVDEQRLSFERSADFDAKLEALYQAHIANDTDCCPTGREHAPGLYSLISRLPTQHQKPLAVKGQITGPVTWTLGISGADQRPILYDDELADAAAKFLRLKAAWQEKELRRVASDTIIFLDEPSLSYLGSAFVSLARERAMELLNEVFGGITGFRGVHCCANTDWSLLMEADTDIVSFDAYGFAENFALYPEAVARFTGRGGAIAWGVVPNTEAGLLKETVSSLKDRLEEAMGPFTRKAAVRYRDLLEHGLLTPSCSLAGLSTESAARALELLADLSAWVRRKHGL